jgi:hypothetical protein
LYHSEIIPACPGDVYTRVNPCEPAAQLLAQELLLNPDQRAAVVDGEYLDIKLDEFRCLIM